MTEIANNNIDIEVVDTTSENAQYFWHNTTDGGQGYGAGAHITQVPKEDFIDDPDHGGGNTLITSTGLRVRDGLKDLAEMSKDGFDAKTYDAQGNEVVIAHLGYGPGTDSGGGTSDAPYYTLGERLLGSTVGNHSVAEGIDNTASGVLTHAEGYGTTASGSYSHSEGAGATASGYLSHAEGGNTTASGSRAHAEGSTTTAEGANSHAEGNSTTAKGDNAHAEGTSASAKGTSSHAEGNLATAEGDCAHAEGKDTKALGDYSHAEGAYTSAYGDYSHAEGAYTSAYGDYSHASGRWTTARGDHQFVIGKYNEADFSQTYAFMIGNGDNITPSNALTVDWNGNTDIPSGSQYKVNNKTATFDALTVTTESFLYPAISSGSGSGARTATFSNSGYYPLGVIGFRTGNSAAVPTRFNLSERTSGQAKLTYVLRAVGAVSAGSGDVDILWVKET